MIFRRLYSSVLAAAVLAGVTVPVHAADADYPNRPIRLVVSKPPGGLDDVVARTLQPHLQTALGQPVIVENIPGADGNIGTQQVIRAEPDGYRLLLLNTRQQVTSGALVVPRPPFDLSKDVTPIVAFATFRAAVIAHPSIPGKDLREVLQYAAANPDKVIYGTTGPGSLSHLVTGMAAKQSGAKMLAVPYKGGGPASVALAAGEVHLLYTDLNTALTTVRLGKGVRVVGQSGETRAKDLPDIPLFSEQGFALFADNGSLSLVGPRGMPAAAADKLSATLRQVMARPDVQQRLGEAGLEARLGDAQALAREIEGYYANWVPQARAIVAETGGN